MQKFIGLALLLVGLILLFFGFQEGDSIASSLKESITGSPTDRSIALIIGGVISACAGLGMMLMGRRAV